MQTYQLVVINNSNYGCTVHKEMLQVSYSAGLVSGVINQRGREEAIIKIPCIVRYIQYDFVKN